MEPSDQKVNKKAKLQKIVGISGVILFAIASVKFKLIGANKNEFPLYFGIMITGVILLFVAAKIKTE